MVVDGQDSNELFVLQAQVRSIDFTPRDLNLFISDPHFVFPAYLGWIFPHIFCQTCLKLAFMCHFSIVQGVLLLIQMSKTLFEKKVMNSLAEAELLIMLSSGRMMSLCLHKCVSDRKKTKSLQQTYFSTFSSVWQSAKPGRSNFG